MSSRSRRRTLNVGQDSGTRGRSRSSSARGALRVPPFQSIVVPSPLSFRVLAVSRRTQDAPYPRCSCRPRGSGSRSRGPTRPISPGGSGTSRLVRERWGAIGALVGPQFHRCLLALLSSYPHFIPSPPPRLTLQLHTPTRSSLLFLRRRGSPQRQGRRIGASSLSQPPQNFSTRQSAAPSSSPGCCAVHLESQSSTP